MTKLIVVLALLLAAFTAEVAPAAPLRRFALFVGRNDGGASKPRLKYATTDALSVAKVIGELGGVGKEDRTVLLNPTETQIRERLDSLRSLVKEQRRQGGRTQFMFYYSGHSTENGLSLGDETLPYGDLREAIRGLDSDVSIVVLDSCSAGNFTRAKGGHRVAPFLTDSFSKLRGYVALTSSSLDESAQESDRIRGSYFTHHFVSGLRGAADFKALNRVTLEDAYQYAYHQTLATTENSVGGPQHPSYNIELSGSGELVLTDLTKTSAKILFDRPLRGRVYVRDEENRIVAEVDKVAEKPMVLSLEPGKYSIILVREQTFAKAALALEEGQATSLSLLDFRPMEAERALVKGGADKEAESRWDLSLSLGLALTSIKQDANVTEDLFREERNADGSFQRIRVALYKDISSGLTLQGGGHMLFNVRPGSLSGLGLDSAVAVYAFGGSPQRNGGGGFNLAFTGGLSIVRYDISNAFNSVSIEGTTLQVPLGVQMRVALTTSSFLQFDASHDIATMPMSNNGIRAKNTNFDIAYRALF